MSSRRLLLLSSAIVLSLALALTACGSRPEHPAASSQREPPVLLVLRTRPRASVRLYYRPFATSPARILVGEARSAPTGAITFAHALTVSGRQPVLYTVVVDGISFPFRLLARWRDGVELAVPEDTPHSLQEVRHAAEPERWLVGRARRGYVTYRLTLRRFYRVHLPGQGGFALSFVSNGNVGT